MPDLGAKTQATPGIGLHPGFPEEGANLFNAVAATQGAQYYQYTGNTEQPCRLTCTLSGSAFNLEDPPSPAADAAVIVNGGLCLWDGPDGNLELPYGQLVDIHQVSLDGSQHAFHESGSASILVSPGDLFHALAFVAASVAFFGYGYGYGYGDASQTLTVAFTAGDASQLTPLLQAGPEPATTGLMTLGLAVGGALARRRLLESAACNSASA